MAEKLRAVTSGSGNLIPRLDVVFGCQFALLIDSCLHTCSGIQWTEWKTTQRDNIQRSPQLFCLLVFRGGAGEEQKALLC